jgi:short-subunit dehydrogenase
MEVNLFALAEMTREALPLLKQGRQPLIVNIASILGHRGIPYAAEYCASKFAVRGFSESLRAELTPHGIGLLVVSPGTTDTEFFDHLIENRIQMPWAKQTPVPASLVAQRTLRAMRSSRHEIIPNFRGRLLIYLNRLAPRFLDRWMAGYVK